MIRVGRRVYSNGSWTDPSYEGFKPIIVMTASSEYGSLSPYQLKDSKGRNMENIWQFSKVYKKVPKSIQKYSRWNQTVIWNHPAETHVDDDGNLTDEYFKWRKKGMYAKHAIRYPVGYNHRHKCLYAIKGFNRKSLRKKLNYVQSRKEIYVPLYCKLVRRAKQFKELKRRFKNGENLLIIEVDGPHQESLAYYKNKYGVKSTFIDKGTIKVNKKNMKIMLNDPKHPFGHGYCLAMSIMDIDKDWSS